MSKCSGYMWRNRLISLGLRNGAGACGIIIPHLLSNRFCDPWIVGRPLLGSRLRMARRVRVVVLRCRFSGCGQSTRQWFGRVFGWSLYVTPSIKMVVWGFRRLGSVAPVAPKGRWASPYHSPLVPSLFKVTNLFVYHRYNTIGLPLMSMGSTDMEQI